MKVTVTILGCGNSAGTPTIGNYWGQCNPDNAKNRRTRPSIAVQSAETTLIIDTGPDFRTQINDHKIDRVDAVLYSHAHGDHINGIDDLRILRLRQKALIPVYGNFNTLSELQRRFDYLFVEQSRIYPEVLDAQILGPDEFHTAQMIGDIAFIPFEQDHGTCRSVGYRFGDLAYSTDVVDLDQQALETLRGVKTWIVDGAGYKMPKNMAHFRLNDLYEMNEIVQADQIYLTHLTPAMDYDKLCHELPDNFAPSYDGLKLTAEL